MQTISVIIPTDSLSVDMSILNSLKNIDYPQEKIEIILSIGRWPSAQRNKAARIAGGEILYFFNRDARPQSDVFNKVTEIINKDTNIAGVGGPDLTPADSNYIQHLFGYAMGSYFAHWKMRARYSQVGKKRVTDEKELLLSNIAIRRDVFLESCGFNEQMYPNEENELINRISRMGYKFIYTPDIKVYRERRKNIFAFIKQFYRYGQGRMHQVFVEGIFKNLHFFMPVIFLAYLISLPFAKNIRFIFMPLFIYVALALIDSLCISLRNKRILVLALPVIYIIMHISYSVGMLNAALKKSVSRKKTVSVPEATLKYAKKFTDV